MSGRRDSVPERKYVTRSQEGMEAELHWVLG